MSQNLSSGAVVIGALRVKDFIHYIIHLRVKDFIHNIIKSE